MLALRQRSRLLFLPVLLLASVPTPAECQTAASPQPSGVTLATPPTSVLAHLQRVDALLDAEQWSDAAEILRGVMEEHDHRVMPVGPRRAVGFQRYVRLSDYCQMSLARMADTAPDSLAYYRRIIDAAIERAKRDADSPVDAETFSSVVDRYFVGSGADEVLLRLGDLEVERGNWNAARRRYEAVHRAARFSTLIGEDDRWHGWPIWLVSRMLQTEEQWQAALPRLRKPGGSPSWLVYPDSQYDAALVVSRLALVSILESDTLRAGVEIELLRRMDAKARGQLAGRESVYVEILEDLLKANADFQNAPADDNWLTLGGAPQRQRIAASDEDAQSELLLGDAPRWQAALPLRSAEGEYFSREGQRVAEPVEALLSYHPIVVGDQVIVQVGDEAQNVVAFGLRDGQRLFGDADADILAAGPPVRTEPVRRYSLSANASCVFAGLSAGPAKESRLVGFDLASQGKLVFERRLDREGWGPEWTFDGPPLAAKHRLFVTLRRRDTVHSEFHVACFDELHGDLLWIRKICSGRSIGDGRQAYPAQTLLTLSEDTVYCNTHLGVIAALRASDGQVRWLSEYPRISEQNDNPDRNVLHVFRDLTPCLAYRGLVIAAPCDSNRLFALDAITGHLIWTLQPEQAADVIHLLGVGADHLIASGDYLYWLDVYSGRILQQFPPPRVVTPGRARPSPRGHGRGVLVGDNVYWPTRNAIYVFGQGTVRTEAGVEPHLVREIDLASRGATGGNLVAASDALIIAAADQLYVFDRHGQTNAAGQP